MTDAPKVVAIETPVAAPAPEKTADVAGPAVTPAATPEAEKK